MVNLTDKELISKLQELRQIKPQAEWASLAKTRILGTEPSFSIWRGLTFPRLKPAFAGFIAVFVLLAGLYGFAKNSLPGDTLYSIKKISERSQAVFISKADKPAFQLRLANDRLEDLTRVSAKNLAPTIIEFQANVSEAAKDLAKAGGATSSDPLVTQKIVDETKKLKENEKKVMSLGMVIEGEEIENFEKAVVKYLIKDLEQRSLTEEKEDILDQMKELFEEERYSDALELYLLNQ